ncbi:MAG: glycosyltransferase family 4 protein [Armatimonadota bacterium]|nr:glycosyltransferase family 4 protein [Armatimonadota bacterium]
MKILHVQKVTGIGGSERHLLDLLPALAARGVEVRMVVLTAGRADRFLAAAEERRIAVDAVPAGPDVNPVVVSTLVRLIRRFRPDLIHTHLIHADLHGAAAAVIAGVPTVSSFHGTHPFFERPGVRHVEAWALRRACRVIAISHWVARFLASRGLAEASNVRVVHYGVDRRVWQPLTPDEREAARRKLHVEPDAFVVVIASRLVTGKGHDTLFRAVAQLGGVPLRLVVVGDGPERERLNKLVAALELAHRVRFLGFVPDVRSVLAAADVAAVPTSARLREGFGLAALEAQVLGVPVVASATASLPEIVADGETGMLVPPDSVPALADALAGLAADPMRRRAMGEAAVWRARQRFSLDRMVEATIEVYREALGAAVMS